MAEFRVPSSAEDLLDEDYTGGLQVSEEFVLQDWAPDQIVQLAESAPSDARNMTLAAEITVRICKCTRTTVAGFQALQLCLRAAPHVRPGNDNICTPCWQFSSAAASFEARIWCRDVRRGGVPDVRARCAVHRGAGHLRPDLWPHEVRRSHPSCPACGRERRDWVASAHLRPSKTERTGSRASVVVGAGVGRRCLLCRGKGFWTQSAPTCRCSPPPSPQCWPVVAATRR